MKPVSVQLFFRYYSVKLLMTHFLDTPFLEGPFDLSGVITSIPYTYFKYHPGVVIKNNHSSFFKVLLLFTIII